jgi:hypothetical protein
MELKSMEEIERAAQLILDEQNKTELAASLKEKRSSFSAGAKQKILVIKKKIKIRN